MVLARDKLLKQRAQARFPRRPSSLGERTPRPGFASIFPSADAARSPFQPRCIATASVLLLWQENIRSVAKDR